MRAALIDDNLGRGVADNIKGRIAGTEIDFAGAVEIGARDGHPPCAPPPDAPIVGLTLVTVGNPS